MWRRSMADDSLADDSRNDASKCGVLHADASDRRVIIYRRLYFHVDFPDTHYASRYKRRTQTVLARVLVNRLRPTIGML